MKTKVAVCIITYKRPDGLKRLLEGLNKLTFEKCDPPDLEIIIVDNDKQGSARDLCENLRSKLKWPINYCIEPRQGIPYARNKSISCVTKDVDFIALIDDDEVPDATWMDELLSSQKEYNADVVHGKVIPYFPDEVPPWIIKGKFFEEVSYPTGYLLRQVASNTTLIKREVFESMNTWFDERFALTGGEDWHFFWRVYLAGYKMIKTNDAVVYEWIPKSRTNAKWILQRAYRVGTTFGFCESEFETSIKAKITRIVKVFGRIVQGIFMIPLSLFMGQHIFIKALGYICRSTGILTGFRGFLYEEYRTIHGS